MMAGKANAHVFVVTVIYGIGVARRKLRGTNYTTRKGDDRTARGGALAARLRREMLKRGSAVDAPPRSCAICDDRGRFDYQINACEAHATERCTELRVIDRRR
jgi:hypothetical protein